MIVSFTGTSKKGTVTNKQRFWLEKLLRWLEPNEIHHGDCIEADAICDKIARRLGIDIVIHPPNNSKKRAFCGIGHNAEVRKTKPYKIRNRIMVDVCDLLIAAPHRPEYLRSGTWSTVRYARRQKKQVIIVEP